MLCNHINVCKDQLFLNIINFNSWRKITFTFCIVNLFVIKSPDNAKQYIWKLNIHEKLIANSITEVGPTDQPRIVWVMQFYWVCCLIFAYFFKLAKFFVWEINTSKFCFNCSELIRANFWNLFAKKSIEKRTFSWIRSSYDSYSVLTQFFYLNPKPAWDGLT
jgi:hypothetical protein